ncbi:MAG: adenylyl-sulfate kinase [Mariprofundales bacterium]|nr:adenylyl-sulfate kinase [Mariprofundales bacterium]
MMNNWNLQPSCIWFTGLSGAGKSTVSTAVADRLRQGIASELELLDGDVVRTNLSKGLGFSRQDRDTNILRIGWVCQLLVKHHASVLTAAISPYRTTRSEVRAMVEATAGGGSFVEVFVNASVECCTARDVKGLYARAIRGEIKEFTGVSDPYQAPENPEIILDTEQETQQESVNKVLDYLKEYRA